MKRHGIARDQRGQSTVEFALTLVLILAFSFFYTQLSLVLGIGNYIQYATFMASRAYLSAGPNSTDQRTRACIVLSKMLTRGGGGGVSDLATSCSPGPDRFPTVAKGDPDGGNDMDFKGFTVSPPSQFNPDSRQSSWLEGVRYTFKSRIFFLPLSGTLKREPAAGSAGASGLRANEIRLVSESWLMREPGVDECTSYVGGLGGGFDNGC